jgi:hypothetical protein
MKISIAINLDTRPQNDSFGGSNLLGCVNEDFLGEGVKNKINFFDGFEKEIIVFVDEHTELDSGYFRWLNRNCDTVVVRKHTNEHGFNDNNYLRALQMASGDIIIHADQDTAMFRSSKEAVGELLSLLDNHTVVSYPHWFSPNPDVNDNYDYWWASTRFFMCKKEFLDTNEISKCLKSIDYLYEKYPASIRNPWTEHIIGLMAKYNGNGVFYPPLEADKLLIFSWGKYRTGLLRELNEMAYDNVLEWQKSHPFYFPNDINA